MGLNFKFLWYIVIGKGSKSAKNSGEVESTGRITKFERKSVGHLKLLRKIEFFKSLLTVHYP